MAEIRDVQSPQIFEGTNRVKRLVVVGKRIKEFIEKYGMRKDGTIFIIQRNHVHQGGLLWNPF